MERKFKAVAMRFTQEEFDKMDKTGITVFSVFNFSKYPYLINNYSEKELWVTNYSRAGLTNNDRTIIETCNPQLFREYCGLESVEDELKEAISKNKRGFLVVDRGAVYESFNKEKKAFDRELKINKERIIRRKQFYFGVSDNHNDVYLKGCFSKEENLSDFEKGLKAFEKTITVAVQKIGSIIPVSEEMFIEKEKTFKTKDIQCFCEKEKKWVDDVRFVAPDTKCRFKPNPTKTLDTEIEALNQKAKEMGFKAVITFEML